MGRLLKNKINVDAPSAEFPNGQIRDDTGSNNGTPVDERTYGDLHQTEERGVQEARRHEADVQMDRLADSTLNDYQFYQARRKVQDYASLYKEGLFNFVLGQFGAVDFIADCCIFQGELYVCDQGSNDVEVFQLSTGAAKRTLGAGLSAAISIQVVAIDSFGEGIIYIADNVTNQINTFNATTGAPAGLDITTVIGNPSSFQVDWVANRIYVLDNNNRVEVFDTQTTNHIPGESFGVGGGALDVFVLRNKNLIYTLTPTKIFAYDLTGAAQTAFDILGLTAAKKFHIIAEKMYIIDNAPTDVIVWDIRKVQPLQSEDVLNASVGNINNLFIRNGTLFTCDLDNNAVNLINAQNVQEYV